MYINFNQCLIQNILLHYSKFHFIFRGTADKTLYVNPNDPGLPDVMQDDGPGTDASADSDSDTSIRDLFMAN